MAAGRPRTFCTEEALESALRVFWEKGYEGASLQDRSSALNQFHLLYGKRFAAAHAWVTHAININIVLRAEPANHHAVTKSIAAFTGIQRYTRLSAHDIHKRSEALIDLITFFTIGPKEARAWTVRRNAYAPQAAGEIHTDFEKGFIRAETIACNDYLSFKGEQGAKEAGKLRLEGKEYVVQDGDVMHFRFNV